MVISNENIFRESFTQLKSFLNDNITDPRRRYKKNWIHSSMPEINSSNFDGYPFIIVTVNVNEEDKSFDVVTSEKVFRVLFGVYSKTDTEIDTISDSIHNLFKDEDKLTDFKSRELNSSPMSWTLDQNGKKILFRNIGMIFRSRL